MQLTCQHTYNCSRKRQYYAIAFLPVSFSPTSMFCFFIIFLSPRDLWFKNNLHNQFVAWIIPSLLSFGSFFVVVFNSKVPCSTFLSDQLQMHGEFYAMRFLNDPKSISRNKRDGFWSLTKASTNVNFALNLEKNAITIIWRQNEEEFNLSGICFYWESSRNRKSELLARFYLFERKFIERVASMMSKILKLLRGFSRWWLFSWNAIEIIVV